MGSHGAGRALYSRFNCAGYPAKERLVRHSWRGDVLQYTGLIFVVSSSAYFLVRLRCVLLAAPGLFSNAAPPPATQLVVPPQTWVAVLRSVTFSRVPVEERHGWPPTVLVRRMGYRALRSREERSRGEKGFTAYRITYQKHMNPGRNLAAARGISRAGRGLTMNFPNLK